MPMNLRGRSLLSLVHHTPAEIDYLIDLAIDLKKAKRMGTEARRLVGKNIALVFEKTSTRTRSAFEVAAHDQGAGTTFFDPSSSHRFARFVRAQLTAEGTREDGFLHQVDACQRLLRCLLCFALARQQVVDEAHDFVLFGEGGERNRYTR